MEYVELGEITPDQRKALLLRIEDGMQRAEASAIVGIPPKDLMRWMAEGEGETPGPGQTRLVADISQAEAKAVWAAVEVIRRKGKNWQREAWWLSHRHPDLWGERSNPALRAREPQVIDFTEQEDPHRTEPQIVKEKPDEERPEGEETKEAV